MRSRLPYYCLLFLLPCLPVRLMAQTYGCTDPLADNYNAAATRNDGSCTYPAAAITAARVAVLSDTIRETSGLVCWNGLFWTHNDDTDTTLYALDTASGAIVKRITINGAPNHDWEEITQDDNYFYIGDFGNNANGNRRDLAVLRIAKAALAAGQTAITPDKIFFSYSDQTGFAATGSNNTDFDCEAFIAAGDSLYLFTKQWISGHTKIYALPKVPGTFTAHLQGEYGADGLITGAAYIARKKTIVLTGYKIAGPLLQPFLVLLYDFPDHQSLLGGNKRRITLAPLYHQTEAIATTDGQRFYLTNERLSQSGITITPQLQQADLSAFLNPYYNTLAVPAGKEPAPGVTFYPNPCRQQFAGQIPARQKSLLISEWYDGAGRNIATERQWLQPGTNTVTWERARRPAGTYWLKLTWESRVSWGRISLYD